MKEQKQWEIKFYKTETGKCPVNEFRATLTDDERDWMDLCIEHLSREGFRLRRPQADLIRDNIYELRVQLRSRKKTRTLYFFCFDDYIVLTHTFIKRTDAVPPQEIKKALKYKDDFLQRFDKSNIGEA